MGVRAPRGQRLPSDTVWASPPLRGPGFVRGNHTPLHGNASALCCFGIERGHCSPSILHGRVTECGGPVPPPRLRWAGRSPTAGQVASTLDSFPQMGRCGDRASLARGGMGTSSRTLETGHPDRLRCRCWPGRGDAVSPASSAERRAWPRRWQESAGGQAACGAGTWPQARLSGTATPVTVSAGPLGSAWCQPWACWALCVFS